MEFFAEANFSTDETALQLALSLRQLPSYCASIERVLRDEGGHGLIYCVWGEFPVQREVIKGGVRFTLPTCPNALAWTITTGQAPDLGKVVIHCTINRREHDADFIDSIEKFVQDWKRGLERAVPG
jgi:hypothetical protein